jgi:hypothetical protein
MTRYLRAHPSAFAFEGTVLMPDSMVKSGSAQP